MFYLIVAVQKGGLSCCMGDLVPCPGLNLGPLNLEYGVLATRPPEKSPVVIILQYMGVKVLMLSILKLDSAICQLYLNKMGEAKS